MGGARRIPVPDDEPAEGLPPVPKPRDSNSPVLDGLMLRVVDGIPKVAVVGTMAWRDPTDDERAEYDTWIWQ